MQSRATAQASSKCSSNQRLICALRDQAMQYIFHKRVNLDAPRLLLHARFFACRFAGEALIAHLSNQRKKNEERYNCAF